MLLVILFVLSVSGGFVSVGYTASSAVTTANEAKEISIEASKEIKQITEEDLLQEYTKKLDMG